jgi:hypothetical protein
MDETNLVRIFVGAILLFLGRRLFWFFVGAAGFIAGLVYAPQFFQGQPGWVLLLIALAAGVVGALLAVALQRVAVALAGFFIGGYLLNTLLAALQVDPGGLAWLTFLIGGLVGALLVSLLFDWALILLSSLTGAMLVAQSLPVGQAVAAAVFIVLLIAGIVVQAGLRQREAPTRAAIEDEGPH